MSASMTSPSIPEPWFAAWTIIARYEGSYLDKTPSDPGNWTGGAFGQGKLVGSKFGVSARAFPDMDIAALTFETAGEQVFKPFYWDKVLCDLWPGPLGLCVADAEWNDGPAAAPKWLQKAAGLTGFDVDGLIGPQTEAAVAAAIANQGLQAVCASFNAKRTLEMSHMALWRIDGAGWCNRLARLPFDAMTMPIGTMAPVPTAAAGVV